MSYSKKMNADRHAIRKLIQQIKPSDEIESAHQTHVMDWIDSGARLFRTRKPDVPQQHLVSYFVLYDEAKDVIMLIDHVKAGLWLPTGGHVDVNENPMDTVIREAREELQVKATFSHIFGDQPLFITATQTRGYGEHTDVSLWYVIEADSAITLEFDRREINGYKWISLEDVLKTPLQELDPHMHRFSRKMRAYISNKKSQRTNSDV